MDDFRSSVAQLIPPSMVTKTEPAVEIIPAPEKPKARKGQHRGQLTHEVIGVLERTLREGMPIALCCRAAGISPKSLNNWLNEAEVEGCTDELKLELHDRVTAARAEQDQVTFELLKGHSIANHQVALRLAEAQNPDVWVPEKKSKLTVDATVKPQAQQDAYAGLTIEQLKELDELEEKKRLLLEQGRISKALPA